MGKSARKRNGTVERKRSGGGPVAFFVALFIVALGTIQLVSTFHAYALSLAELNGLKRQESSLIAQKRELENDISRWDDKSYVTAQARDRLGFVFPGEIAVHVNHPEAVTGDAREDDKNSAKTTEHSTLPWYSELSYAMKKADEPVGGNAQGAKRASGQDGTKDSGSKNGTADSGGAAGTAKH